MTLQLRTARLVLRPVDEDDLDTLLAMRNAPAVVATTSTGEPLPRERMAEQLSRWRGSWRERGLGSWLVLLDSEPVGFVEVAPIGEGSGVDPDAIEIGVVVHPEHWGKGYALEAGLAAARDLFGRVALDRVYVGVDPDNEKSLRALAKASGKRAEIALIRAHGSVVSSPSGCASRSQCRRPMDSGRYSPPIL